MENKETKYINKTLLKYCTFAGVLVYIFFNKYIDSHEFIRAMLEGAGLVSIFYELTEMGIFMYKKLFAHK